VTSHEEWVAATAHGVRDYATSLVEDRDPRADLKATVYADGVIVALGSAPDVVDAVWKALDVSLGYPFWDEGDDE
jgi:hypothetical protein